MRIRPFIAAALLAAPLALSTSTANAAAAGPGSWSVQVAPLPPGVRTTAATTTGVSCVSDALCALAIGSAHTTDGAGVTVADLVSGSQLSSQVLPQPAGSTRTTSFGGVACTTLPLCLTASTRYAYDVFDSYDGSAWTARTLGSPPPELMFTGVACSTLRCLTTGYYVEYDGRHIPYLVDRDNATGTLTGHTMSPVAPQVAAQPYQQLRVLSAPACAPGGECYALGYASPNGAQFGAPYLVYRSGADYKASVLPVPNGVSTADLKVGGLSCSAPRSCATIGTYLDAQATHQYLAAEVLRAGVLETDPIPIPHELSVLTDPLQPRSIDCPAVNRCVGVVGFRNSAGQHGALLVRFNGVRWSSQAAPAPSTAQNGDAVDLTGVACISTTTCVATGSYLRDVGSAVRSRPLVETWAAGVWTASTPRIPADLPGVQTDVSLSEVSCGRSTCLADGRYDVSGAGHRSGPIAAVATGVSG